MINVAGSPKLQVFDAYNDDVSTRLPLVHTGTLSYRKNNENLLWFLYSGIQKNVQLASCAVDSVKKGPALSRMALCSQILHQFEAVLSTGPGSMFSENFSRSLEFQTKQQSGNSSTNRVSTTVREIKNTKIHGQG